MKGFKTILTLCIAGLLLLGCSAKKGTEPGIAQTAETETKQTAAPAITDAPEATKEAESGGAAEATDDFTVYDMEGNEVRLSDFFGKPIVVNFWATWCGYCVQEFPHFQTAYAEHGEDVVFMMVNLTDGSYETRETVETFLTKNSDYTFPVYLDTDGAAANIYRVSAIPMTLFISAEGELVKKVSGAMSESALLENMALILPAS